MDRNKTNTRISRITNQQLNRLITCLEAEPDIARNLVRGSQNGFWRKVASNLNDIGPARKDVTGWKRAWFDYKCSLKKRATQYNADIAAGIYPKHLSPTHRRVMKLLGYEIKKAKLTEEVGSGSEDMHDEETTQFDAEDHTDSNMEGALLQDDAGSDDDRNESTTRSSERIRACQKRLEKLPNITIKMHRNDMDPLGNGGSSSRSDSASAFDSSTRKRAREANFRKALETNQMLITAVNASLAQNEELIGEMRAITKTCEALNENMRNVCDALRDFTEVLKSK
ncbi:uncharacterized protein LOC126561074 [Anopheles maculipalpis]|uniref:uncharacterized protein LOC126561074 n=1 Tax=Anopheles maculipalpis TaxID=1496333 RepID=UPI0021595A6E|nr:uncharacterized protein LOC126561074 [Anopheles maculipalpis]